MEIGISDAFGGSPARDITYLQDYSATVEGLGFGSLWMPEHVVFFPSYESRYPYNEDGVLQLGPTPGVFDPFLALTAAALATSTLKVGTSVLLIGERHPMITAREVATLDQFSGGRFLLGVGVGWSEEEYRAMGIPWERRGPRCDEYIEVMKELWTTERSSYHGEFLDFDDVLSFPKPVQQPHPPVLVGGNTPPALRRAARLGDGWFGWNLDLAALEAAVGSLRSALETNGRDVDAFILQVGLPFARSPEDLEPYLAGARRLGLDRLVLSLPISRRTYKEQLSKFASGLALG